MDSIQKFGFTNPVLISDDDEIIAAVVLRSKNPALGGVNELAPSVSLGQPTTPLTRPLKPKDSGSSISVNLDSAGGSVDSASGGGESLAGSSPTMKTVLRPPPIPKISFHLCGPLCCPSWKF